MAKPTSIFICSSCGFETTRWYGKCPGCEAWNTLTETVANVARAGREKRKNQREGTGASVSRMSDITASDRTYQSTGIGEFDRVLGGGIVEGSLLLVGGEPGVGKSTLLLQACGEMSRMGKRVLYISGEESPRQIKLRANRLGIGQTDIHLLAENAVDAVSRNLGEHETDCAVIDSIQTMYLPELSSAPGSVSQVRECASVFMRHAKTTGCAVFLVGHVTKEGAIAGPRILEHMVDVVLYFEGDFQREYRLLRAVKNRYGSVNELGIFEMTGGGMRAVENASETLLSMRARETSGSVVFCAMEGTRPVMVDIQALAVQSAFAAPRRTVNGIDQGRVALLLAVLEKRAGLRLFNQDVFINVAGGLTLGEPAADLAVCLAVSSSLADRPLPMDLAAIGEVGLAGEVRPVPHMERRIAECVRLGYSRIVCPRDQVARKLKGEGLQLKAVATLSQAIAWAHTSGS